MHVPKRYYDNITHNTHVKDKAEHTVWSRKEHATIAQHNPIHGIMHLLTIDTVTSTR